MLLKNTGLYEDFIKAFADDLAILLQGIDLTTLRDIAYKYINIIDEWCKLNGVKLSELKTTIIIFSSKNRKYNFRPMRLNGQTLEVK